MSDLNKQTQGHIAVYRANRHQMCMLYPVINRFEFYKQIPIYADDRTLHRIKVTAFVGLFSENICQSVSN